MVKRRYRPHCIMGTVFQGMLSISVLVKQDKMLSPPPPKPSLHHLSQWMSDCLQEGSVKINTRKWPTAQLNALLGTGNGWAQHKAQAWLFTAESRNYFSTWGKLQIKQTLMPTTPSFLSEEDKNANSSSISRCKFGSNVTASLISTWRCASTVLSYRAAFTTLLGREKAEADPSYFNRPLNVTHITEDTKLSSTEKKKNLCPTHNYLCEIKWRERLSDWPSQRESFIKKERAKPRQPFKSEGYFVLCAWPGNPIRSRIHMTKVISSGHILDIP